MLYWLSLHSKKIFSKGALNYTKPVVLLHFWDIFLLLTGDRNKPSKRVLALPQSAKCCRGTRAAVKQLWSCISFSSPAVRMFYKLFPSKRKYISEVRKITSASGWQNIYFITWSILEVQWSYSPWPLILKLQIECSALLKDRGLAHLVLPPGKVERWSNLPQKNPLKDHTKVIPIPVGSVGPETASPLFRCLL